MSFDEGAAPGCDIMAIYRSSARGRSGPGYQRLQRPPPDECIEIGSEKAPVIAHAVHVESSPACVDVALAGRGSSNSKSKQGSSNGAPKGHPLLNFMEMSCKKKRGRVKPELVRYLEYVKEFGTWDANSGRPVIYYK